MNQDIHAIVLAAGKGSRMASDTPKVLLEIAEKPILWWTLNLLKNLQINKITLVLHHNKDEIINNFIDKSGYNVEIVDQKSANGTAGAVIAGLEKVDNPKNVLVVFGDDSGLYKKETIKKFIAFHNKNNSVMTMLTLKENLAKSIGGLRRDQQGNIIGVATGEDLVNEGATCIEVVCGIFCFDTDWLKTNIKKIKPSPYSGEYTLPSLLKIAADQGKYPLSMNLDDANEWNSLNTPAEYEITKSKKLKQLKR